MTSWLALSDRSSPLEAAEGVSLLAKATLVLEFELPLEGSAILIDFKTSKSWPRALSIFVDEQAGVVVMHRQGDRLMRHVLPGHLGLASHGVGRISFGWDGPGKSWTLSLEQPGHGKGRKTRGRDPMPMFMEDLLSVCQGADEIVRHRSVLWFGLMDGSNLPERAPWIGLQTPIETANGPCPAGKLRAGDLLLTEDGDYAVLQSLLHMDLPSRGSFSPVMLRAPYFGAETDILVSSDQLVAISGDEVEYLFSDETVLTEARNLTDGRAALMDFRRAITSCVSLDIGMPRLIRAEDCRLLTHFHEQPWLKTSAPHLVIQGYETIPLLDMLGRTGGRAAA
jgi:hypothetical protein